MKPDELAGGVWPELPPLWSALDSALALRPVSLQVVRNAMLALFEFLSSPSGRTEANVVATDWHFSVGQDRYLDWEHLPPAFDDILTDAGFQLHDTFSAPEIALATNSTPEQLLARTRALNL
jgi:hypothetical protein